MDVQAFIRDTGLSDAALAAEFGRDRSYWTHLRHGTKTLGMPTALRIWRERKVKVGPLAEAADHEIEVLDRFQGAA